MRKPFILLAAAAGAVALSSAPTPVLAAGNSTQTRIAQAFVKLGMKPKMSACYGRVIASRLSPEKSRRAAKILESSKDGADVRKKVNEERGVVRGAFMAAKANCGLTDG